MKDAVAIITGAASGIGRETAFLLSKQGFRIAIIDKSENEGRAVARDINRLRGSKKVCIFQKADVSLPDSISSAVKGVEDSFGRIDLLVNNAGIQFIGSVTETPSERWNQVISTNLTGVFLTSKYVLPMMIRNRLGVIVNVASVCGFIAYNDFAAYCASKGGVVMLTKSMALDYAKYNIRVNCVCPGEIQTPMTDEYYAKVRQPAKIRREIIGTIPIGRYGDSSDVAKAVLFLATEQSSYATGSCLFVDGGMTVR